jgi:hypothetical protein
MPLMTATAIKKYTNIATGRTSGIKMTNGTKRKKRKKRSERKKCAQ